MSRNTKKRIVIAGLSLVIGIIAAVRIMAYFFDEKILPMNIPFVERESIWSIGIYVGDSSFSLVPTQATENPVLTAEQVTDVRARFVADPFMVKEGATWYMFFEVMNDSTNQGDIGLAISEDGFKWDYRRIVLDEPCHLSYPYIFKTQGKYYMIPETNEDHTVRLYQATEFPTNWRFVADLLTGTYVDPSIFYYQGLWWLFVGDNLRKNDTLRLFYSASLEGPFVEHPRSPIVAGDANIARPAGRVLVFEDHIVRFAQDDDPTYGNQVWAFEVYRLTTESYEERQIAEQPILQHGREGWNRAGMHQIDAHQVAEDRWMACVDGYERRIAFGPEH